LVGASALAAASRASGAVEGLPVDVWLKTCRALICEAYNPPFYPSFDFKPEKAVKIATELNSDSLRYPAASYYAYFPTKSGYPVDVMYFDGPYQGMMNAKEPCQCKHCQAAYQKRFGKPVPTKQDDVEYVEWMANDVVIAFLREIRQMIRDTRDVPVLFNDTSLLSRREWRNRAIPVVDGFMFEAAETPEDKLFNLQLGHSTGKTIWTYVGTHTQYNREHMKSDRTRGWFSYPVESQELLLDGATAMAGSAGIVYWGLSRFFFMPQGPLAYESGRYVKEVFDLSAKHRDLLASAV